MASPLTVRRVSFDFEDVAFHWHPSAALSAIGNATSFGAVAFERMVCRAVKEALPLIADERLRAECEDFIAQEAMHSAAHRLHVRALVARYPEFADTTAKVQALCDALFDGRSLKARLGFAAVLEGVLPAVGRHMVATRGALFADADPRVSALLLWHFCEEIEHEATAVQLFRHLYPRSLRAARIPLALRFVARFTRLMEAEFSDHAPARMRRDRWRHDPHWAQMAGMIRRAALSPWPGHKPGEEPVPEWAKDYLERVAASGDPVAELDLATPPARRAAAPVDMDERSVHGIGLVGA